MDPDDVTPADIVLRYFSLIAGAVLAVFLLNAMCSNP